MTGRALTFVLIALAMGGIEAQTSKTRIHVETLASGRFDGRLTGTAGERLARDYIASELRNLGARPLPGRADFLLPFEFTAGSRDGGSSVSLAPASRVFAGEQVRALSFSDSGDTTAGVVFAGYGLVVPPSQDLEYDSYATLDVTDKVVLVLRYFPEDADPKTRGVLARYADLRYKAMAARQRGAKAMLVVAGPRSPNAGTLVPMGSDTALSGSGIVAVSITADVAAALLSARPDVTLASAQQALDSANPHVSGFEIPNVTVTVRARVEREKRTGYNVAGYLPSTEPDSPAKPWVALGAHYDHLGQEGNGLSLARKDEAGRVHAGADDNASGSAAVLAAGAMLAQEPRKRHVLLAFWSGEELGLLGSAAFAANPPVPLDEIEAYLNFDMVGRMQDNKLIVQAAGSSPIWPRILEQANVAAGFDLRLQPDPYQPTDVTTFNGTGTPTLNFFTGVHTDYHRPSDTAEKIAYEDLDRIAVFAAAVTRKLASLDEPPLFAKVEPPTGRGSGRGGVRVFTGTIPDYTSEAKGLLLGGVIDGGPADRAGLRKGDVIVEIGGQSITNIYDYTYALDVLKIGSPSRVIYVRDGERRETTLVPAARR